jgi:hypothetical protein
MDEFAWMTKNRLDVPDPDGAMTDRARTALINHVAATTERPQRRLPWLAGATASTAVAGAAAAVVVIAGGSGTGSTTTHNQASRAVAASTAPLASKPSTVLVSLAHTAAQSPALPGNATLIKRSTVNVGFGGPPTLTGYDLYEDNGDYYYGQTLAELQSTVNNPSPSDSGDASLGQVIAAAAASANLTPSQAAEQLLAADSHPTPRVGTTTSQGKTTTWTQADVDRDLEGIEWQAITAALEGGAGQPQVRAGALLAASAMPNTTVTTTTYATQPAVTVTWNEGPDGYSESVTVNNQNGVLLDEFNGGASSGNDAGATSNTTYQVSRVTAPSLAPAMPGPAPAQ